MHQLDGGGAVAGDVHRVARALQAARQEVLNPFFVLDDQYSHRRFRCILDRETLNEANLQAVNLRERHQ
jgi:autonomous glycyl radical cofactor GrcA